MKTTGRILGLTLFVLTTPARLAAAPLTSAATPPADSGFRATVIATAKDLPGPVAFSVDERGVIYTANSRRAFGEGIFDIRSFPRLFEEDLRLASVEERRAAAERWIRTGRFDTPGHPVTLDGLRGRSEEIRRLEDTDGDGKIDRARVIAAGMNDVVSGAAAGVLAWDGRIFATVVPELMVLADTSDAPSARRVLQSGFGLHLGQMGHDLHGLTIGNDGRLYFSMADRGFHFTTREGVALDGHTGAVFRCWPDGTGLELWARGLRNPQELAFTDTGDLFTGDNNADMGDRSRLLYLPEGSDAGWHYALQTVKEGGPWTLEHLWDRRHAPDDPAQPAWLNAAVDFAGSCPAGFAAYPGTGLPHRFDGTLWLADFLGGVSAIRVAPRGAGYEVANREIGFRDSWSLCDFEFGVDGRAYALYWGESWGPNAQSRLVALDWPAAEVDTAAVAEVRRLFREGFRRLGADQLAALLGHADRRVRQRASFELARRGAVLPLANAAGKAGAPLARMHALWGLGIVAHERGAVRGADVEACRKPMRTALGDGDAEVRRTAARLLGEADDRGATAMLITHLTDGAPRVRFACAQALGRMRVPAAAPALIAALAANGDQDATLRIALAQALGRCATPAALAGLAQDARRPVRLGAVLALRESGAEEVANFLHDRDAQVATEAARAAYDLRLPGASRALAQMLANPRLELYQEAWLRRALHAALRVGTPDGARWVAMFAADPATSEAWRTEALRVLRQWDQPDERDGVWGIPRPVAARPPGAAHEALLGHLNDIMAVARGEAMAIAVDLAGREHLSLDNRVLLRWVGDEAQNEFARVTALRWLQARGAAETGAAIDTALASHSDSVYATALRLRMLTDPPAAIGAVTRTAADRSMPASIRQAAVRAAGASSDPSARAFLAARVREMAAGALDPAIQLDVLEAARTSDDASVKDAARRHRAALESRGGLAPWMMALHGGNAERGRQIFFEHPTAQCVKCHTVDGTGGTAGPDLSGAGSRDRRALLESLILPQAVLVRGYEATLSMPSMNETLSAAEVRDLVEFLAAQHQVAPDMALGKLRAESATTGFGAIGADRSCRNAPLRIAGRTYAAGVGVHAPSRIVYEVPAGYRAFVAQVGVDDESLTGRVEFEVALDGRVTWRSGPMRPGAHTRAWVEIPAGTRRLELRVGNSGDGNDGDYADWCEAGFVK